MAQLLLRVKTESVPYKPEISRCKVSDLFQSRAGILGQDFFQQWLQETAVKYAVSVGGEVVEAYFVIKPPDRCVVEPGQGVGGADQDASEALHLGEEFIGHADLPRFLCHVAAEQKGIDLVNDQHGVAVLSLGKHAADVLL